MPKISALGGMSSRGFGEFARQAAGAYIEDVFSTYLYNGTDAPQTIANGIDLSGNGGLVWLKSRSGTVVTGYDKHILFDTVRTNTNSLSTNSTAAVESGWSDLFFRFKANGFDFGTSTSTADQSYLNNLGVSYASWTFREKQKFFDVVSYTGNGANRTISHNLGSVPGMIIIKRTNSTSNWAVYHRSLANTQYLAINTTAAAATDATYWNSTTPTATDFSLGTSTVVNASGGTYVAYLFAHDAGGFGADGSQNAISCGSFTTDASGNATVSLGYEPQFVMFKASSTTGSWRMYDNMRGIFTGGTDAVLYANLTSAEDTSANAIDLNATGFSVSGQTASTDHIYLVIRRGPMRTPTSATNVFQPIYDATSLANKTNGTVGPVDMTWQGEPTGNYPVYWLTAFERLIGSNYLVTSQTYAEAAGGVSFDTNVGVKNANWFTAGGICYNFGRAPGFFDVVCYTGTSTTNQQVTHNLGTTPELIICKRRDNISNWSVYVSALGRNNYLLLDSNSGSSTFTNVWGGSDPTSTTFNVDSTDLGLTGTIVSYLFATCPNVSKVGSYTGTGATQTISCGFTGGARFVMIKRTDTTGDWYAWDTSRGMVAGTDYYLLINSSVAQVNSNSVYTTTGGFQIVSTAAGINASGGTYIYLAIA